MALAFLGVHKQVALEARWMTFNLYRSLIKSARQFQKPQEKFLADTIRERFRFHRHESSRPRVLNLLREGNEALRILEEAPTNTLYMERIDALVRAEAGPLKHSVKKLRQIPNLEKRAAAALDIRSRTSKRRYSGKKNRIEGSATVHELARIPESVAPFRSESRRTPKMAKRKPYHIVKDVTTHGYTFKRLRGWRQPVRTAMMMKNRVKKLQQWVDQQQDIESLLDTLHHEQVFYDELGIRENMRNYAKPLMEARTHYKTIRSNRLVNDPFTAIGKDSPLP